MFHAVRSSAGTTGTSSSLRRVTLSTLISGLSWQALQVDTLSPSCSTLVLRYTGGGNFGRQKNRTDKFVLRILRNCSHFLRILTKYFHFSKGCNFCGASRRHSGTVHGVFLHSYFRFFKDSCESPPRIVFELIFVMRACPPLSLCTFNPIMISAVPNFPQTFPELTLVMRACHPPPSLYIQSKNDFSRVK